MANGETKDDVQLGPKEGLVDADGVKNDPAFVERLDAAITAILAGAENDGNGTVKLEREKVKGLVERAVLAEMQRDAVAKERDAAIGLARVDSLTELPNRRALMEALEIELGRAERKNEPVSLLLIDIDHFKRINDTMGHAEGDVVLQDLAKLFRKWVRGTTGDIFGRYGVEVKAEAGKKEKKKNKVGRYGGEEFICIAPQTNGQAALIAERLRAGVEAFSKTHPDEKLQGKISISVGVATFYPDLHRGGNQIQDLIKRADRAMYLAKEKGRNRVVVLNEKESPEPFELTPERLAELRTKYGGAKIKDPQVVS